MDPFPLEYIPGPSRVILSLFGPEQPFGGAGLLGFQRFEVVAGILCLVVFELPAKFSRQCYNVAISST